MKKQLITLFFIFSLVAPATVTYVWLQHRKHTIRKEIKKKIIAGISKNELVLLKFSKKEINQKLKWKHSKEFEFSHQMYDIVSKSESKDSIQYWCWWDYEETKLNKQLKEIVAFKIQKDFPTKDKVNKFIEFQKTVFCSNILEWKPDFHTYKYTYNSYYNSIFSLYSLKVKSPPPDFLV